MYHALRSGILLGAIHVIFSFIAYFIDPLLLIQWWYGLTVLASYFGLVIYFGIQYRSTEGGGYLSFKEGFIHGLLTLLVAGFLSVVFQILLYNVIDPELTGVIVEASIQQTYEMLQSLGAPEAALDEAIAELEDELPNNFSILGILKSFLLSSFLYAIFAVITAAIIKKKNPELL